MAIGVIGLMRETDGEYEIHYWLATERTGRGYVTEAAQALLEWARDALGARRIAAPRRHGESTQPRDRGAARIHPGR